MKCFSLQIPRKDRDEKMNEQNFYLANDNKDCVAIKGNIGLTNLWKNSLCKFPQVTLDTAEAILKEYPTKGKLIKVSGQRVETKKYLKVDLKFFIAGL